MVASAIVISPRCCSLAKRCVPPTRPYANLAVLILHKHGGMKVLMSSLRPITLAFVLSSAVVTTQTRIVPPDNNYTPAQDVELGQKAAAEARREMPLLRDDAVTSYIEGIGRRLVAAIPPE